MDALTPQGSDRTRISVLQTGISPQAVGIEWQYSTRRDFQFAISPVLGVPMDASVVIGGLNQGQTYWIRPREVFAGGVRGPWAEARGFSTAGGTDPLPDYQIQIEPAVIVIPETPSRWFALNTIAGYAPENMGRPSPAAAFRCSWSGTAYLFAIETNGQPIDTVAILETNLPELATVRFFGSDTAAGLYGQGQPAEQTAALPFRASPNLSGRRGYHHVAKLPVPLTSRFITAVIENGRVPGDVCHITHAVFGRRRTIKNYADMTDQPFDLSTIERLRDGSPDAVAGFRGRKVDFELAAMTERQHEAAFADLAQRVGLSEPVFIMPNSRPGAYLHDRLLYGNLTLNRQTNSNARFTRSLSIESIINP